MKLLSKTSLIFITISLFVFFISGILLYIVVKNTSDRNINQELNHQFEHISRNLPEIFAHNQEEIRVPYNIHVKKLGNPIEPVPDKLTLKDTLLSDPVTNKYQMYRKISGYKVLGDNVYRITIIKSLIQSEELIEQLIIALTSMTILLILGVFFVTRITSERIWTDFFATLETIKKFDLAKNEKVKLPPSDISEFNELNHVLNIMIARIFSDFENLKEFTENITHEIQSPLAIIKTKAELMLQADELSKNQAVILSDVLSNIGRLKKLNNGLVLLTRIENNQFKDTSTVDIRYTISEALQQLRYLAESNRLKLNQQMPKPLEVTMNLTLADVLINNLLRNAFIHTPANGNVSVIITNGSLTIKNTGHSPLNIKIFNRFVKSNYRTNSLGIGLSLVQKICVQYGFKVRYSFKNQMHVFIVDFT